MSTKTEVNPETVREKVRAGYAEIAQNGSERRKSSCCCGMSEVDADALAKHIGYTEGELAALPGGANIGLSCGNPGAIAALKPGEVLLDLGSGAGFDAFIAAPKVGSTGRVIGVDMTAEMLAKARKNAAAFRERTRLDNVEFRLGEIEHLPVADASVDVVISNCVINLSPDKPQVWREIARVLKLGGRVAVSDLALLKPLPKAVAGMVEALVGCIAGAVLVSETERMATEAGLTDIRLKPKDGYVAAMTDGKDPLYQKIIAHLPKGSGPGDYITSLEVTATKAASAVEYSPAVNELVAIGAAIAANCEPCLKYHYREAGLLGVSKAHMARAVAMAASVKDSPHQAILRLADKLTGAAAGQSADTRDRCCGSQSGKSRPEVAKCCG